MITKSNQACSTNRDLLSLSSHLNDITIIIWAAATADIPTVHQHGGPEALGPCPWREGGGGRWARAGGGGGWVLREVAGPRQTRGGSCYRQPAGEHGPSVEARQRLAIGQREAWWQHCSHACHTGSQHIWGHGCWSTACWWCWGRCRRSSGACRWRRGGGDCASSTEAKQVLVHVTGFPQMSVRGLEIRRASPHEKPKRPTQHGRVDGQRREAVSPREGEPLWGHRGWGVFSCRLLLTGMLLLGRAGGLPLGAYSQVLSDSSIRVGSNYRSHRGIVVLHIPAAVGLRRCGGRRALLRLIPGASRAPSVALQLADDLWAVRGKRAGQNVGGFLLLRFRRQTAVGDIGGLLCWSLEGCQDKTRY